MPKQSSQGEAEKYWKQALMAEEQKNLPEAIRLIEKAALVVDHRSTVRFHGGSLTLISFEPFA